MGHPWTRGGQQAGYKGSGERPGPGSQAQAARGGYQLAPGGGVRQLPCSCCWPGEHIRGSRRPSGSKGRQVARRA